MKEFTPEQIEAMKHFPRTLPEDRRRFCELFLTPPSRQDVLEAQKREAIERRKQQIREKGSQALKKSQTKTKSMPSMKKIVWYQSN